MDDLIANHRALLANQLAAIRSGLAPGAGLIEDAMRETDAYRGMSGATRASNVAYVADATDSGASEAEAAYNTAAGLLQDFTGHSGRPSLGDVPGPDRDEAWIVATVPTDYSIDLETERGGEKAFIADAVHANAPAATNLLVARLREGWRR